MDPLTQILKFQNPKFWVTDFSLLSLTNSKLKILSLLFETGKKSGVRHVLLFHTFFFHVLCSYEYLSSIDCINIQAPNSPLNLPVAESAGQIGFWCFFCNIVCTSNSLLHIIQYCYMHYIYVFLWSDKPFGLKVTSLLHILAHVNISW